MDTLDSVVTMLNYHSHEAFVLLDALDEHPLMAEQAFSGAQPTSGQKEVLEWLYKICEKHTDVRFLITSRNETDVCKCLDKAAQWDVAKGAIADVDIFI